MRILISCFTLLIFFSCEQNDHTKLMPGHYRATLEVQDNKELPFNFKVTEDDMIEIYNAEEVIKVDEISYFNDSIRINFQVFEGYITGKFKDGKVTDAQYIKESLDRYVPVNFQYDISNRFLDVKPTNLDISGIWEMVFTEQDGSTFVGKGIFEQDFNKMTGTIRTETGDYRFLEGVVSGNQLKFSAFDGAHAFLFTAKIALNGNGMKGEFYSGNHYKAIFKGKPNPDYELRNENELTFLKDGFDSIEFSFPDLDGNMVSLSDEQFQDEVVIVQIMGSWCPNCLDESKYYTEYFKNNPSDDLEFVALAFEYAKTEEKAFASLRRLKERIGIEYPILLAQYGTSDKAEAQKKLPMLNHVLSYPTTIFMDKKGKVRKIHTGFNGPATGQKYVEFKKEFEGFVNELLSE
ncbi:MAG: TlpA family protein disulfide reductase [Bacteroidia bacterium]|nr:TlpA family protein disulfide reductase [Bacteroidia bacterium]RZV66353.1 MAG: TlpA family protein disulfide reductase [Flavobacteriaceae bacterium]